MPKLVRLYLVSVAVGFALAAAFVAALVALDVAGLGRLVTGSGAGWLAGAVMVVLNGIVFSGVQFGIAVMGLADRGAGPRGGRRAPLAQPVPVAVPAAARRRR